jgi:hypothetical protein
MFDGLDWHTHVCHILMTVKKGADLSASYFSVVSLVCLRYNSWWSWQGLLLTFPTLAHRNVIANGIFWKTCSLGKKKVIAIIHHERSKSNASVSCFDPSHVPHSFFSRWRWRLLLRFAHHCFHQQSKAQLSQQQPWIDSNSSGPWPRRLALAYCSRWRHPLLLLPLILPWRVLKMTQSIRTVSLSACTSAPNQRLPSKKVVKNVFQNAKRNVPLPRHSSWLGRPRKRNDNNEIYLNSAWKNVETLMITSYELARI